MNDLFAAVAVDLPEEPMTLLPAVSPRCCVCGTGQVFRIQPGQMSASTALWYRPVATLPNDADVPTVAWCLAHDPVFAGVRPRVPEGEREYLSWRAA